MSKTRDQIREEVQRELEAIRVREEIIRQMQQGIEPSKIKVGKK